VVITGAGGGQDDAGDSILMILRAKGVKCLLCAPTGRAAKRLTETTGMEAKTIHRLLGNDPRNGAIQQKRVEHARLRSSGSGRNLDGGRAAEHSLVRAVPNRAGWFGRRRRPASRPWDRARLQDLIESGVVPVVRLTEVFSRLRTATSSANAHRIRRGQMPDIARRPEFRLPFRRAG